jgi:hypothetical protein
LSTDDHATTCGAIVNIFIFNEIATRAGVA